MLSGLVLVHLSIYIMIYLTLDEQDYFKHPTETKLLLNFQIPAFVTKCLENLPPSPFLL